jgi:hypothetical protein
MNHLKTYKLFEHTNIRVGIKKIPYQAKVWKAVGKTEMTSGTTDIIDISGRKIILLDINGVNCPFYLSSGAAGKKDVPAGKWYPFFGISSDGWINKGSSQEINSYYGIDLLKYYGQYLDKTIGDVRNEEYPKAAGSSATEENKEWPHIKAINKDLVPAINEMSDSKEKFKQNIEQWKQKLRQAIQK